MRTTLNFEQEETKKLLAKYDFEFFLTQNFLAEDYPQSDVDQVYHSYASKKQELEIQLRNDRKQFNYYCEGQIRKMFTGGFLPSLFHLDESRSFQIFNFNETGECWAYFFLWQKYYKKKLTKVNMWIFLTRLGSILAIILSLIKILEVFIDKNI